MRRQLGVVTEYFATTETAALVEADGLDLVDTGLKPKQVHAGSTYVVLDASEQRLADTAAAYIRSRVHALDLGETTEERDAAATDGFAPETRHEKPDVRLEQLIERQCMPLLGRVG